MSSTTNRRTTLEGPHNPALLQQNIGDINKDNLESATVTTSHDKSPEAPHRLENGKANKPFVSQQQQMLPLYKMALKIPCESPNFEISFLNFTLYWSFKIC